MRYTMNLPGIHQVLVDVAGDGAALQSGSDATAAAAESLSGLFGDAGDVGSGFDAVWSARSDVAPRVSRLLFLKANGVAGATEAFRAGDSTMEQDATAALSMVGAPAQGGGATPGEASGPDGTTPDAPLFPGFGSQRAR